jgi:hypothetical protein
MRKKLKLVLFCILSGLLAFPSAICAAELFMEPQKGELGPGSEQKVTLRLGVEDVCVNTVEAIVSFPQDYLQIENVFTGNSLLHIWVEQPSNQDLAQINRTGRLHLAGGIPGGYCGRIPGDPGESDIIAEIIFSVPGMVMPEKDRSELVVFYSRDTRVLLNDGQGTEEELETRGAIFDFTAKPDNSGQDWRRELAADRIKPEPFVVELRQDASLYDGQYFIVFSTVDKQTGIDHYEVLELSPGEQEGQAPEQSWWQEIFGREKPVPQWQVAETPYLLRDQSLTSVVKVKALDKAGNARVVEYIPEMDVGPQASASSKGGNVLLWIIGLVALAVLSGVFGVYFYFRKNRVKNNIDSNDKEEIPKT